MFAANTRQSRGASHTSLSGPTPKAMIDKYAIVPITACIFALILFPLLIFSCSQRPAIAGGPAGNSIFLACHGCNFRFLLAVQNRSRLTLPPHLICLLAYLAFAGASVLWAFSPERSFIRYLQQVMIVISIVLPAMLAARTADMMRALFLCFVFRFDLEFLVCIRRLGDNSHGSL